MTNATFTPEMVDLLRSMRGEVLESYEYREEGYVERDGMRCGQAYGEVRLNLAHSSLAILCEQEPREYFGALEDVAVLSCRAVNPKAPPSPHLEGYVPVVTHLVGEAISSVELVHDHVFAGGDETIDMDAAVVIRTTATTVTLARGGTFEEMIYIAASKGGDAKPALPPLSMTWHPTAEACLERNLTRTVTEL